MNKYFIWVGMFVLGGVLTYLFLPTKIETKTITVQKDAQIEVHYQWRKEKKPDGTIVETGSAISNTASHEESKDQSTKLTGYNSKKLLFYGGFNILHSHDFLGGGSYNFWGPCDIGGLYHDGAFVTLGVRF